MSRVPLENNEILDLDSSNIKQTEDSDMFIWNEKLATLDRNFETQLNLDDSVVVSRSNNPKAGKGKVDVKDNFTFKVKNSELIFNKKKVGQKEGAYEEWEKTERERETLIENIRLSGYKKSRETSGALESSLRTGDSSNIQGKPSMENSHHTSGRQSIFTRKESYKKKSESNQSIDEYDLSARKRPVLNMRGNTESYQAKQSKGDSQLELIRIVRENEQLKIKNRQLKELAKKLKNKNKERKDYIKKLNLALEETLEENDNLKIQMKEMRVKMEKQDEHIEMVRSRLKEHKGEGRKKVKVKRRARSVGRKKEKPKPQRREQLGGRETAQVQRLIKKARKFGSMSKEDIKASEVHSFIFQLSQNKDTGCLESLLLNKTVYTQTIKRNFLTILLDKIFRTSILEKYWERVFHAEPSLLFLPREMVDEVLDSDFSEYLEDLEDDEEVDDFDEVGLDIGFSSKMTNEADHTWSRNKTPLMSEEITPKKGRVGSLDKRRKTMHPQVTSKRKRNFSKTRSEKNSIIENPRPKKRPLFDILGGGKQWPENKVKVETGRRAHRRENFYSHIADRHQADGPWDNLCRSNMFDVKQPKQVGGQGVSEHKQIFQKFGSDSDMLR
jgi:hypothetical protein